MKAIIKSIPIIILLIISSCESDFIDREPLARMGDVILFSNETGAIQALNGCYDILGRIQTYRRNHYEIGDCLSDDSEIGGQAGSYQHSAAQDLSRFISTSDNSFSEEYWKYCYRGISRCNEVISRTPEIEMDEDLKNRILSEARFLRALFHFNLNNAFGGIPIIDHPLPQSEYYNTDRSTRAEVYLFIINELKESRDFLPVSYGASEMGRATRGAANALLAKTYLFTASLKKYDTYIEWNEKGFDTDGLISADEYFRLAKETAELVMDGTYSLMEGNFQIYVGQYYEQTVDAFRYLFTVEGNNCSEKIFEVQHFNGNSGTGNNYNEGNDMAKWCLVRDAIAPDGTPIPKPGFGFNCPTQNLLDEFEPEDSIRLRTTITTDNDSILWEYEDSIQWVMCDHKQSPTGYGKGKIRPIPPELFGGGGTYPATQSGFNINVLRYADVLLIHAEACAELGLENEARADLKKIRNRVGLSDYPVDPKYTDILEAVRHERRIELALEAHRWLDIVRWGVAKEKLGSTSFGDAFVEGKHEYLPINDSEVRLSNVMKQNKGY